MKAKRNLLIGLIFGVLIGWVLGFLRLPYLEKNYSFLLGFVACLAVVLFGLTLLFVWNKNSLLIRLIGRDRTGEDSKSAKGAYSAIWILVALFILTGGLVSSLLIVRQNTVLKNEARAQNIKIAEQSELIASVGRSSLVILLNDILEKVDDELENSPGRTLREESIARIVALNRSFQPYRYWEGDSLSDRKFSPERGQLLLALATMNIDSGAFAKIKTAVSFAGADLREADLTGADLSRADLRGAMLKDAKLDGANLAGADLTDADLWGANLNAVNLSSASLKRAELSWAELNEAVLNAAVLDGANFTSAKLRGAELRGADLKWADLSGAVLQEANLEWADLRGTRFHRTNLFKANLKFATLRLANFNEANLTGTILSESIVQETNWFEKLKDWQVIGADSILASYKLVTTSVEGENRIEVLDD